MQDSKGLLEILRSLLVEPGAQEAAQWVLPGDGAEWAWKGVRNLAETVGFDPAKVVEVVDLYHLVERLHRVAAAVKHWSEADREAGAKRMKHDTLQAVPSHFSSAPLETRPDRILPLPPVRTTIDQLLIKKHRNVIRTRISHSQVDTTVPVQVTCRHRRGHVTGRKPAGCREGAVPIAQKH